MGKINDWQAILKEYDEADKVRVEYPERYRDAVINTMNASQEAFRKLLAVAVAAVELRDYQNSLGGHTIPNNREVEHLMGLHEKYLETLKALDQS